MSSASDLDVATATVTVSVKDIDDNGPVYERKSYCTSIDSTIQAGTFVGQYKASDADTLEENKKALYEITDGDANPPKFEINPNNAQITTRTPTFDEPYIQAYNLVIEASHGDVTATATVHVLLNKTCSTEINGASYITPNAAFFGMLFTLASANFF